MIKVSQLFSYFSCASCYTAFYVESPRSIYYEDCPVCASKADSVYADRVVGNTERMLVLQRPFKELFN